MECMVHSTNVTQQKGNTMNNTNETVKNIIAELEKLGVPVDALKEKMAAMEETKQEEEVFTTPRIRTNREEKFYSVAEKVLDKTFNAYGVVKDKAIPKTVEASKTAVVVSRSWLGNMLKKVGEKIEPKKS